MMLCTWCVTSYRHEQRLQVTVDESNKQGGQASTAETRGQERYCACADHLTVAHNTDFDAEEPLSPNDSFLQS